MTEQQAPWDKIDRDVIVANDQIELPLAPPQRPLLLNALVVRFAQRREDKVVAIEVPVPGEKIAQMNAALHPGPIEIALTSGFGQSRTISLSPAELLVVLTKGRQFLDELPR